MVHARRVPRCRHMWNRGSSNHILFYDGDTFGMLTVFFLRRLEVTYAGAGVGSKCHCWIDQPIVFYSQDAKRAASGSYLLEKLRPQMKHLCRRELVCVTRWRLRCSFRRKDLRQSGSVQTKGPDVAAGARREGENAMFFSDKVDQGDQGDQGDHEWIKD